MTTYLSVEQVLEIHDAVLKEHGGLSGIRDENLLHSALEAPKMAFLGQEMYPTLHQKAAVYLYHIVKNHAFNDGNKRTGCVVTVVFLKANRQAVPFEKTELERIVLEVAKGDYSKEDLAFFLEFGVEQKSFT